MDTCTIEVGLLRKKPCGEAASAKCANCEQALCNKHAMPLLTPTGRKTGNFLCPECMEAHKRSEKDAPPVVVPSRPAEADKPAAAAKPAAPAAAAKPAAPGAAAAAIKPEEKKEEEQKHDDDAPLEFTPSKPPEKK